MSANYLEVVQTEEGEVVLRRAGTTAEPLVSLRFSPEVRAMLGHHLGDVAMVMLGAGMQATSQLAAMALAAAQQEEKPRLLH